ncbi:MAG: hypothetical protein RLZZ301_441 [Bacteroidota bacterium]|jgi:hypothetical protein
MKALFLSFFTILGYLGFAQAPIVIHLDGQTTDLSGQTHSVSVSTGDAFDVPFDVENHSGAPRQWRITRKQLSVPAGWTDALCWGHSTDPFGGTCYSSGQMNTNPWTTPGAQTVLFTLLDGEYGKLKVAIDPADGTYGLAHYRYYISDNGAAYLDSVDLVVDYLAAVKPVQKEEFSVSVGPNPSTDYVQIQFSGADQLNLKLVDALGNVLDREVLYANKKISVADLNSGVYFLVLETPSNRSITKKLVVRH